MKTGQLDLGGDGVASVGDTITYAFSVKNTGNVDLTNVTVADTVGGVIVSGGPLASLAVGATDSTTFTGTYALTQADINAGTFTNTAEATGYYGETPVTDPDDDTQTLTAAPAIELVKTGQLDLGGDGVASVGDTITYAFSVKNTGNVDLTNVTVADTVGGVIVSGGPLASLAVGATDSTTFTGTYALTQVDINAGTFTNTATATGYYGETPVTDPDDDTQTLTAAPAIELVKTGQLDLGGDGVASVGDTITYAFSVKNTGNVDLTNVTVADTVGGVIVSGGPLASLAVGATDSTTFTGTYALTQVDINAGTFTNTATATGYYGETPVTDPDDDTQTLTAAPAIELVKTGQLDLGGDGVASVGDTITYAFSVKNTGNVDLTNVTVADTVGGVIVSGGPLASLAVGATDSTTFTGTYALTQVDINAGTFTNTATATGYYGETPVTDPDDDTQTLTAAPGSSW